MTDLPSHDTPSARPIPDLTTSVYRVVVVDDHELLREGTRRILDSAFDFTVVGEAGDGDEALVVVGQTRPDVVLMDIRLPSVNGIDLARTIIDNYPSITVLILSAYDDEVYMRAALAAGVAGYLLKTMPADELLLTIRAACEGAQRAFMPQHQGEKDLATTVAPQITAREHEVVRLVARGMTNKAIASQLGISPRTVEGHLNRIFDKIGATTRTELVHYALASSVLPRDEGPLPAS